MSGHPLWGLALLLAVLNAASPVLAQVGGLFGSVTDLTGAVATGASVTLTGPNFRDVTTTGASGEYRFDRLAPGTYQILVMLPGFSPATRDNVVVDDATVTVPVIALSPAGVAETVVVSATRAESLLINAPATMTVLPGRQLAISPAQNYGDLLRAVPGLNVIQMSARDVNMTSRQATNTSGPG